MLHDLITSELSKANFVGYLSHTCVFTKDFVVINHRGEESSRRKKKRERD